MFPYNLIAGFIRYDLCKMCKTDNNHQRDSCINCHNKVDIKKVENMWELDRKVFLALQFDENATVKCNGFLYQIKIELYETNISKRKK